VGGGPGGLTLARLLQLKGVDVTVYERDADSESRSQGATLDLHDESGLAALRAAGLMDEFQANYRPGADRLRITDKHAKIVLEDDINKDEQLSRPEIDRGPLQRILLESLLPGTVVWDSRFVHLNAQGDGWQLQFANGNTVYADIVIAADGANSKIRPYITPIKPFFAGITAVEGLVYNSATTAPNVHRLLNGGKIFALGDDKSLIVSSKGDGSMAFYTGVRTTEQWSRECGIDFTNKADVLAWFKQEYDGWADIWQELFENSAWFVPRPQFCMPPDQTWEALPNLTMVGDAAHLMPPYAGEGVNMAMLDALELSERLTDASYNTVHAAISVYETGMRHRAAEAAEMTLQNTEALHATGAIGFLAQVIS